MSSAAKTRKNSKPILPLEKKATQAAIEKMMTEPSGGGGPVIAVVGSTPSAPQAGMPLMVVPGGYTTTQRRPIGIDLGGGAYDEFNMIGVGYVIEQSLKLRQPTADIDPALYRCAHTVPAEPFASRGHCNPDYVSITEEIGKQPKLLPFSLETTSAKTLEEMMNAKTLTSKQLVKAELYRIALTNADGPAIQAIRNVNDNAVEEAEESDQLRFKKKKPPLGALAGIPVVVDDSMNVFGLPTSAGSIALQDTMPSADSAIVAKLKAAGAIILGDTNTTELGGAFEGPNMPQGYSSLGGQVLLASDTNKNVGGSSGGWADAVSVGLSPLAIGMETSTEAAQLIAPASNAGVVGLKPTVGLISRTGTLPVAKSQDSPGPIGQTVTDVATTLGVLAGPDPSDPATLGQPPVPNYLSGLTTTALSGKKIAVIAKTTTVPYPEAVAKLATLGATTNEVTPGTGTTAPSVIPYEFHSDLNAYLSTPKGFTKHSKGAKSLQEIIEYNNANPVEGLKFGQAGLVAAEAVETSQPGDENRLRRKPRERKERRPGSDRRHPQNGRRLGHHGPERQPAGGDRRSSRLPGADGAGRIRRREQLRRWRPDRGRFHRHRVQRGRTPGRRLRLRTGDESTPERSRLHGVRDVPEPGSVGGAERDLPERLEVCPRERVPEAI